MSALHDFAPERVAILHKEKPLIDVRGLNLDDVSALLKAHLADIESLVEMWDARRQGKIMDATQQGFLLRVLTDFPAIAAAIIANACSDEDKERAREAIRRLPLAIQVRALEVIWRLTMEDFGGPNALAVLTKMAKAKK